jgi:hypothetical protein
MGLSPGVGPSLSITTNLLWYVVPYLPYSLPSMTMLARTLYFAIVAVHHSAAVPLRLAPSCHASLRPPGRMATRRPPSASVSSA